MLQTSWRQSFLQQYRQHARHSTQEEVDTSRFRIGKRHYYSNMSPCSPFIAHKHLHRPAHVTNLTGILETVPYPLWLILEFTVNDKVRLIKIWKLCRKTYNYYLLPKNRPALLLIATHV